MRSPIRLAAAALVLFTLGEADAAPPRFDESGFEIGLAPDGRPEGTNPAHGIVMRFDDRWVSIEPGDGRQAWSLRIALRGWGRPGGIEPAAGAVPRREGARVERVRAGIVEWFVNGPGGLEQGFTIPAAPRGDRGRLVLDLHLGGSLHPTFAADGSAIDFSRGGGAKVLRYAALRTVDATGAELPSRFVAIPGGVRIAVEDAHAIYPVTVDPMVTTAAWTADGDGTGAYFGYSAAAAGDVNGDGYSDLIVGAPYHDAGGANRGRVHLYLGGPAGLAQAPAWTASGGEDSGLFGLAVATAGDVDGDGYADVLIGAPHQDDVGVNRGRAYLFRGSPSGLEPAPSWTGAGEADLDDYGYSLSGAGDVNGDGYSDVVIGAVGFDGAGLDRGRVYLHLGSPLGLGPSFVLGTGDANEAEYGASVAGPGDVNGDGYADVVIGAGAHPAGGVERGRIYLHLGGPGGPSTTPQVASGQADQDRLGLHVGSAGDVNGDGYADLTATASGAGGSHVFAGGAAGLAGLPAWLVTGPDYPTTAGDVNGDGYADILSADLSLSNGDVFLSLGSAAGPVPTAWTVSGDEAGAFLGAALACAGDVDGDGLSDLAVGASGHDAGGPAGADRGRVYVFLGAADVLPTTSLALASGDEDAARLGSSLAMVGDVNGDGYDDAVLGAAAHDAGGTDRGRAYLYLGSAAGLAASPWIVDGDEDGARFGASVAGAGDVNGDGYADVVIGASQHDGGGSPGADRGRVYLYLGSAAGLSGAPSWWASGDENDAWLGSSVAGAGDVNGDGHADVAVAAPRHDGGGVVGANRGKAYLYLGSTSGLATSAVWSPAGGEDGALFGSSVAPAGDVDGDGYGDLAVGAPQHDGPCGAGTNCGRVAVYHGGPAGLAAIPLVVLDGDAPGGAFGNSVGGAGDVNRDGFSDLVAGAHLHHGGGSFRGRAYLYHGTPAGLVTSGWVVSGDEDLAAYGTRVASAGDVNGDGYSDVLVTAALHDAAAGANAGRAYVYLGSASGLGMVESWSADGGEANAAFGVFGGGGGDVDGDGVADLLVSADREDAGGIDRGRVYFYSGGAARGVAVTARQLRADLSAPIAPGGLAHEMSMRVALRLRSPFGRGLVKLQWQLVPLGESWNPLWHPIQNGAMWWDSRVVPLQRSELVALPQAPGPFVWRVRTRYAIPTSPFQQHGPWITLAANGLGETDVRGTLAPPPPPCDPPDERIWIYQVTSSVPQGFPILHFQDPNQPSQTTGYNVYRSSDPAPPPSTWPMLASNVVDMDGATPNVQYTDSTGDVSPTGSWYYHVTAYNSACASEGPF